MPIYEYVCETCGERTERLLRHSEAATPGPCPACDGVLQRRFSRVGVRLQGWGFSATDGMVPDRPGRASFREVQERAERISGGD